VGEKIGMVAAHHKFIKIFISNQGTFMYYTGGYYYYFYAVGNCCPDANDPPVDVYHVEVCRGAAANGPYYSQLGVRYLPIRTKRNAKNKR
jgi:beta-xylosidase